MNEDRLESLIKEVYLHFGLAYYHSEVVCQALYIAYVVLSFESREAVTRPSFEERLKQISSYTLGQAILITKDFFPVEIQKQLDECLKARNYLAHRFWYENVHLMYSEKTLEQTLLFLLENLSLFNDANDNIDNFIAPRLKEFGVTDEILSEQMSNLKQGIVEEPLPNKKITPKSVNIIKAWSFKTEQGATGHVFETDNGELLQLADNGLGWCSFNEVSSNWIIDPIIQKYLPATVLTKPANTTSWNYEIPLSKGAVLQVEHGKNEKTYRYKIKLKK